MSARESPQPATEKASFTKSDPIHWLDHPFFQTPSWLRGLTNATDSRSTGDAPRAIRSFVDSRGASWRVRAITPDVVSQLLHLGLRAGWLTFKSAGERRRLTPIPHDWLTASPSALERYCRSATRLPARRYWLDPEFE